MPVCTSNHYAFITHYSFVNILYHFSVSGTRPNTLYVELAHGGHLGFYEGGLLYPNPITWLDRTLVSLVGSLTLAQADKLLKAS